MAKKKQTPPRAEQPKPSVTAKPAQTAGKPAPKVAKGMTDKWYVILLMAIVFAVNARTISYEYTYDDAVFTSSGNLIDISKMGGMACIPALFTHGKNYCFDKSSNGSYRPLLPATFAVEHAFTGFNPAVSHFINLALACILMMLLFRLLRRMFRTYSPYIPFLIVLLFELHPVHTEVMASAKSRDEILALLFTVMGLLQTFKYIDGDKMKNLALSGVYFFIALLAKESPISFVAIVPVTIYFFTDASIKKILTATAPYLLMAIVFVAIRGMVLEAGAGDVIITENTFAGVTNFADRLGTVLIIQLTNLRLLIFPHPLSFDYSYNQIPITSVTNIAAIISLVIMAGLLIFAAVNIKKKNVYSYSILFYFMCMAVTANLFMQIGATMADRFLFIATLGFCIAVVLLLATLFKVDKRIVTYESSRNFSYVIIGICVLYSIQTMARNEDWKSNLDLFKSGVITAPNSWRAENCLAVEYKRIATAETNPQQQAVYCDSAIKYYKRSMVIYSKKADSHADLGAIYYMLKNYDSAKVELLQALALNPKLSSAAANLGSVYMTEQKYPEAIPYDLTAVTVDPTNVIAQFNLAVCYYYTQKYDSAANAFKKSIQISPDYNNHLAFQYAGTVYRTMGKLDSATKYEALAKQYGK